MLLIALLFNVLFVYSQDQVVHVGLSEAAASGFDWSYHIDNPDLTPPNGNIYWVLAADGVSMSLSDVMAGNNALQPTCKGQDVQVNTEVHELRMNCNLVPNTVYRLWVAIDFNGDGTSAAFADDQGTSIVPVVDVDCGGFWSTCDANCFQYYTVTDWPAGDGAGCEIGDEEERTCAPGTDACPASSSGGSGSGTVLLSCETLLEAECIANTRCAWSEGECDESDLEGAEVEEVECEGTLQASCTGSCVWSLEDGECVESEMAGEAEGAEVEEPTCEGTAQASCTSPCTWDAEDYECVESEIEAPEAGEGAEFEEPACEGTAQASCTTPCAWDAEDFECVESEIEAGEAPEAGEGAEFEEPACEGTAQASCTTPCTWDAEDYECVESEIEAGEGAEFEEPACEGTAQASCTAPCAWDAEDYECVESEIEAGEGAEYEETTCEGKTEVQCTSPCSWDPTDFECSNESETDGEMETTEETEIEGGAEIEETEAECDIKTQEQCTGSCTWDASDLECVSVELQMTRPRQQSSTSVDYRVLFLAGFIGIAAGIGCSTWLVKSQTRSSFEHNEPILLA